MSRDLVRLIILCLLLGSAVFASYAYDSGFFGLIHKPLSQHAKSVIASCSGELYPPSCYDREIPKLMDKGLTMEEAFEVTRIIQNTVDNYFYCHVLGHNLSAKEAIKDPQAWTEVVARCPTGMCSNGCLHGAAQERFREEILTPAQITDLLPTLASICEPREGRTFTWLERSSCHHSIGHLTMYITGADARTATGVCDVVAVDGEANYTQTCYEGAFMQIFQPLEPEDFALVQHIPATTTTSAAAFCDTFSGGKRMACYRESWPLYRDTFEEPGGLQTFCELVPGGERACYNSIFYVLTAQYDFKEERIISMCESVPEERMAQCFANSAARFLETDYRLTQDAVNICARAEEHGVGPRCYDELLFSSSYNFYEDSPEFFALCKALPEPWETRCLNKEGEGLIPFVNDDV